MMCLRLLLALFCVFVLAQCANVVPPTGGPRDAEAPVLQEADPPVGTTSFKTRVIRLTFSEYIRIQNPSQIRISPALKEPPLYTERFNELTIDLGESPLAPNTTYTINFGEALTDLNEGNKLQNFRYVFSTGLFLDSLRIKGKIIDAYKYTASEQVLVGLFPADSLESLKVGDKKPFYYIKTDKQGAFELENLRAGAYVLLAFDDKDNNLQYRTSESVAMLDGLLYPDTSSKGELTLRLFQNKAAILKITEKRSPEPGLVRFRFSVPVDSVYIRPLFNVGGAGLSWWHSADSVLVYHNALTADSLVFACFYDGKHDTVVVTNRKQGDKPLRNPLVSLYPGNQPSVYEPLKLLANRPIQSVDSTKIHWKVDTTAIDTMPYRIEMNGTTLLFHASLRANSRYELFLEQGAFIDWFELPTDTFRFIFNSASAEAFGALVIEQTDSVPNFYTHIELLNDQYELIKRLRLTKGKEHVFDKLRPTSYRLRLLKDENGNGQWDGGDYELGKQPEAFWYYPETIPIRANWEVGVSVGASGINKPLLQE